MLDLIEALPCFLDVISYCQYVYTSFDHPFHVIYYLFSLIISLCLIAMQKAMTRVQLYRESNHYASLHMLSPQRMN